jgi:hypothetical protein
LQNEANFRKAQMRLNSILAKDYARNPAFALRKSKPNFKASHTPPVEEATMNAGAVADYTLIVQNKANLPDGQMNVKSFHTMDCGRFATLRLRKNKAKTEPISERSRNERNFLIAKGL